MAIPEVSNSTVTAAPSEPPDEIFLEGPRSRLAEFFTLLRVMRDFLRGFRTLHFVGPCVTVFGSARIKPGRSALRVNQKNGRCHCAAWLHRDHRWRPWHHGSGKPRRQGSRRTLGRMHDRVALRAANQCLSRSLCADALFLRPQNAAG